jgi:hypothetical protein
MVGVINIPKMIIIIMAPRKVNNLKRPLDDSIITSWPEVSDIFTYFPLSFFITDTPCGVPVLIKDEDKEKIV